MWRDQRHHDGAVACLRCMRHALNTVCAGLPPSLPLLTPKPQTKSSCGVAECMNGVEIGNRDRHTDRGTATPPTPLPAPSLPLMSPLPPSSVCI